ncbi:hypothetical protein [Fusibacter ferrireducens]|uniref:Uncharacterized protein n=1 Tax=Fusibacter ferrireducens TaxID=2785058 RepID=A0ABR9ZTX9_9FIRM|nr:hypothetical protein [Fusibacter ferrireducens]MBF4693939.1 hypothetical protein [Fusibacter ferrireducens]
MRMMHTKLHDFYQKIIDAGKKIRPNTEVTFRGLESFQTGKLPSLRVGRVENEIVEITQDPGVEKVEVIIIPRNTESFHSVIIKGIQKDGTCKKAILENMHISSPGEDYYLHDVEEIDDRRTSL